MSSYSADRVDDVDDDDDDDVEDDDDVDDDDDDDVEDAEEGLEGEDEAGDGDLEGGGEGLGDFGIGKLQFEDPYMRKTQRGDGELNVAPSYQGEHLLTDKLNTHF